MAITVLTVPDCPHLGLARERIAEALATVDRSDEVQERVVTTAEEATTLGFTGSPTILVDGIDPFPASGATGVACRLYPTEDGLQGTPSVAQLITAFAAAVE